MKDKIDFSSIPTIGWITVLIIGVLLCAVLIFALYVISKKNVKSKFVELNEPINEAVKEVSAPKSEKKTEEKKSAEKKPATKKAPAKKPAAKTKAASKTAAAKKTTTKNTAKTEKIVKNAVAPVETVKIQFFGDEFDLAEIKKAVEADYKNKFKGSVNSVEFYIKPEDKAVYYVINGDFSDKVDL